MNKRTTVAAAIVVAAGLALAAPLAASAETITDTTGSTTSDNLYNFGPGYTPAYGEVVVAPATDTVLTEFAFMVTGDQNIIFRGQVFAWDGTKPTGTALFTSAPRTLASNGGTPDAHGYVKVDFATGGIRLTSGASYVIFETVLLDSQTSTGYQSWALVDDANPATSPVYSNDATPAAEMANAWEVWGSSDLAYRAVFEAPVGVSSISPSSGSTAGGTSVVVTGTGFTGVTAVNFGSTAATSFVVNSDTQITAVAPALAAGSTAVTVVSSYGQASPVTNAAAFTSVAPSLAATGAANVGQTTLGGLGLLLAGLLAFSIPRIARRR